MNLPNWIDRPSIVANLFNPAFCGEVIRLSITSFEKESNKDFPFPLAFLILPFLLHEKTRKSFPKTTSYKFYEWLEEQVEVRIGMQSRIKNMVSFTRETISFLIYYEVLKISDSGELISLPTKKKRIKINDDELAEIYSKSEFFGKWLSKTGAPTTIFATIGVEP
jgi:hypothetical protein